MIHFSCSWIGRNRREVSILESNHKSVKNDVLNLPLEVLDIVWPEAAVATSLDGLTDADTAQTFQILGQFCILSAKPGKDIGKTERNRSWSWFDKSLHSKEYMEQCAAAWQNVGRVFSKLWQKVLNQTVRARKSQVSTCWSLSNVLHGFLVQGKWQKRCNKKVKGRYMTWSQSP